MNDYSFSGASLYDEHGPYDMDLSASIRPPPLPYDDPYSDAYLNRASTAEAVPAASSSQNAHTAEKGQASNYGQETKMRRGRGRGRGDVRRVRRPTPTFGPRGWGRGRGSRDRGHGTVSESEMRPIPINGHTPPTQSEVGRLISQLAGSRPTPSPLSMTMATGQPFNGTEYAPSASPVTHAGNGWSFEQSQQYPMQSYAIDPRWYQYPYVQPHINPRFASAFGLNVMGMTQPQTYEPARSSEGYESEEYTSTQHHSVDEWTVYAAQGDSSNVEHREGG
jgi:H/ACA ribonucleoprotein complex non-core subunit NAF1